MGAKTPSITFLGAAGTVTGSKYFVDTGDQRVLVDCGLFQGYKQLRLRNRAPLPFAPRALAAVILTHAHLDHSGYLPLLVKNGFQGPVYSTAPTRDLCNILLPDSGRIHEEDAAYANRRGFSKHHPALPLYTEQDAEQALKQLSPVGFEQPIRLPVDGEFRFRPAGHILGAAMVEWHSRQGTLLFTGDLGRPNDLLMPPPATVRRADYLVIESTYGDRRHPTQDPLAWLAEVLNRAFARDGAVIVPSFAVARAQTLLYYIHLLKASKMIPDIPVFLNSPMAIDVTRLYTRYHEEHRLSARQSEAMCATAQYVNSVEESKALNHRRGPMIIIAGSGMATGGRVLHHLKTFAPDPRNTILFTGYQAGGTRGAAMLAGAETVKIHGDYVPVRAEVSEADFLSAHADYEEILAWLGGFEAPPRQTFVTHGDAAAADALRLRIEERLGWRVEVPEHGEEFPLAPG